MEVKLVCIQDVIMDDGNTAFTKGKTYKTDLDRQYLIAVNNQGEDHCLGTRRDEDKFFYEHFKIL